VSLTTATYGALRLLAAGGHAGDEARMRLPADGPAGDPPACPACRHSADVHTTAGCIWQGCPCRPDEHGRPTMPRRAQRSASVSDRKMTTEGERAKKAEYQRRWRASKGARTGQPGRPVEVPCGTPGSITPYKRHRRRGEEPCPACRAEWNRWQREYHASKRS
jgi:hypothetical protein